MRSPSRTRTAALALAAALLFAPLAACGGNTQEGLLVYTAQSLEGGDLEPRALAILATDIETRIGQLGLARRDVGVIPPRTLRVVLPESAVSRIPEIRRMIEESDELPARLTFVRQGG